MRFIAIIICVLALAGGASAKGGSQTYVLQYVSNSVGSPYPDFNTLNVKVAWPGRRSNLYRQVGIAISCNNEPALLAGGHWIPNDGTFISMSGYYWRNIGSLCEAWAYTSSGKNVNPDRKESNVIQFVG